MTNAYNLVLHYFDFSEFSIYLQLNGFSHGSVRFKAKFKANFKAKNEGSIEEHQVLLFAIPESCENY